MQQSTGPRGIQATSMTRQEYHDYRGWELPDDLDGADSGYLIEHVDGYEAGHPSHINYINWLSKDEFQKSCRKYQNLTFGEAIEAMKTGRKVARAGWSGKGMWVIYNPGSKGETHAMFDGSVYKQHGVDECEILPHFDMYTVNASGRRAMLPGWLASQSDMDADDWEITS